jgi:hypothetical protein
MKQFLFENALVTLILPAAYYILWRLFRKTWQALDEEAHAWNTEHQKRV